LLFQRSTRRLTLTEAGERFLHDVSGGLDTIQGAIDNVAGAAGQPAGLLKISLPIGMGLQQILPMMPEFLQRYPAVQLDLSFDNRRVDLIAQGYDVAIGGAMELAPGVVARELFPIHVVALASPAYLRANKAPRLPAELQQHAAIGMRSVQTGKVREFTLHNGKGEQAQPALRHSVLVNDPEAMCRCAAMSMGVTLAPLTEAAAYLDRGELVRLLPDWYSDVGTTSVYFSGQRLLPAKTRAFVDFLVEQFRDSGLAARFAVNAPQRQSARRSSR
jgi:DNA-binding transcriptional LysR family regulator